MLIGSSEYLIFLLMAERPGKCPLHPASMGSELANVQGRKLRP